MSNFDYEHMTMDEKLNLLWDDSQPTPLKDVKFKINAHFLKRNVQDECYRELMVSYIPMLPLLEKTVPFPDADYILYAHSFARCSDASDLVLRELRIIAEYRKKGAEIIVVGKAANAEALLNGSIDNITFWGDHFTEKLGKKFGFDIREQYFVYDDWNKFLAIWPVDGCLQQCAFCRRTYMHIRFESLPLETIKRALDHYRDVSPEKMETISLRAENLTEYGMDLYGYQRLPELIDLIASYDEVKHIEFPIGLSIGETTPEILDSLCKCAKKIKSLAMNIEVGTDRLLKLINKKHTVESAAHILKTLREANPSIELISTVMIGLPTETLGDICELARLIGEFEFDKVLCNYYLSAPRQPLAKFPPVSQGMREYHLKVLLDELCYTLRRPLEITAPVVYKKRDSRKVLRYKRGMKEDNEWRCCGYQDFWCQSHVILYRQNFQNK